MRVSDQGGPLRARGGDEERVTPLELFFDPVFALLPHPGSRLPRRSPHVAWDVEGPALLTVLWSSWAVYQADQRRTG